MYAHKVFSYSISSIKVIKTSMRKINDVNFILACSKKD